VRKYGEELQTLKDLLSAKSMELQIITKELEAAKLQPPPQKPEEGD